VPQSRVVSIAATVKADCDEPVDSP